ncbi:MAG: DUF3108 domain-containing protein [Candidatus Acidiferrales bacterium]
MQSRRRVALLLFATLLVLMAGGFVRGNPAAFLVSYSDTDAKGAAAVAAMPFRAGEILNYRLEWAPFSNAASVQTAVVERRDLFGWQTWHFRASVHSQAPLRNLFEVDDQFDSYTDVANLDSHQYEMYLDEMGKKQDAVLHLIAIGQSRRGNVAPVIVQPGTRDPLGAFYALRAADWKRTPELRVPLYDGSDLYEMRAHLEVPAETVAITIGNYQAARIAIRLFMHGKEMPQTNFSVWLAHDAARTPVLVEAEMPYGNFRGELTAVQK